MLTEEGNGGSGVFVLLAVAVEGGDFRVFLACLIVPVDLASIDADHEGRGLEFGEDVEQCLSHEVCTA